MISDNKVRYNWQHNDCDASKAKDKAMLLES
jgi:hypothetical protein